MDGLKGLTAFVTMGSLASEFGGSQWVILGPLWALGIPMPAWLPPGEARWLATRKSSVSTGKIHLQRGCAYWDAPTSQGNSGASLGPRI